MKIYAVVPADDDQQGAGPFTDPKVAQIALKIVQMTIDEEAEIISCDVDGHARELKAGLKPWIVSIDLEAGRVCGKPRLKLCWPPREQEGIIFENPGLKEYFVWAHGQQDAIMKLPSLKRTESPDPSCKVKVGG